MKNSLKEREKEKAVINKLACTTWTLARDLSPRTLEAFAAVAINRVRRRGLNTRPSTASLQRLTESMTVDPRFASCRRVVRRMMRGCQPDPTDGAIRFHAAEACPSWADTRIPCAEIGGYLFYRE